jgi:hypothetical protein
MEQRTPTVDSPSKRLRFQRTRIAVSVFFGLVTVALLVLWVRCYWTGNTVALLAHNERNLRVIPKPGVVPLVSYWDDYPFGARAIGSLAVGGRDEASSSFGMETIPITNGHTFIKLWFPIWLPTVAAAVFAIFLCLPLTLQFSLRTLFITTTVLAILLGLAVWLVA